MAAEGGGCQNTHPLQSPSIENKSNDKVFDNANICKCNNTSIWKA